MNFDDNILNSSVIELVAEELNERENSKVSETVDIGGKDYEVNQVDKNTWVFSYDLDHEYECKIRTPSGIPEALLDIKCDCIGFKYRRKCKHQEYLFKRLGPSEKPRYPAETVAKVINKVRREILSGIPFEIAGSYRRGRKDQKDLDILVNGDYHSVVKSRLKELYPGGDEARPGDRVRPAGGGTGVILRWYIQIGEGDKEILLDFHFVKNPEEYPAKLLFMTGSKDFNIRMRSRAKGMGLMLSDRGLFDRETKERIATTEEEIFEALDMEWVAPSKRGSNKIAVDAEFVGYWEIVNPPIPLFNILKKDNEKYRSTVTLETLLEEGIEVPEYPPYSEEKGIFAIGDNIVGVRSLTQLENE